MFWKKVSKIFWWSFLIATLVGLMIFSVGVYRLIDFFSMPVERPILEQLASEEDEGDEKPDLRGKTVIVLEDSSESKKSIIVKKPVVIYLAGFNKNHQEKNQTCQILVKGKF